MDFFEQGFSVREPAWHGLAEVLQDYPGREVAMEKAGHAFTVVERPVHVELPGDGTYTGPGGDLVREGLSVPTVKADGWKALVKDTDGGLLNVVRNSYTVVQNEVLWDIVDAIVDQPNVKYETAGVLKQGAVLWVLALLDEPTQVTGDDSLVYPYVCVSTTHDGSGACKASNVSVRVICWNTYSAAEAQSSASGREFVFRHTKTVMDRIEDAKMALSGVRASHAEFMALAEELAKMPVTESQRELFVTEFLPMPPDALVSKRVLTNVETARTDLRSLFNTATVPDAHKLTAYGCFQAGCEWLDHARRYNNSDTYFGRTMLRQEPAKNKLAKMVREVAEA